MTTPAKAEANRRNAARSTGPRTPEGKAAARLNAMKHGLLSREALLPGEDEASLVDFGRRLRAELRPVGELELLLVDRVVSSAWRLRRVLTVEIGLLGPPRRPFMLEALEMQEQYNRKENLADRFSSGESKTFETMGRYEANLERGFYRALHELQRLQAARAGEPVLPPAAVDVDVAVGPAETWPAAVDAEVIADASSGVVDGES